MIISDIDQFLTDYTSIRDKICNFPFFNSNDHRMESVTFDDETSIRQPLANMFIVPIEDWIDIKQDFEYMDIGKKMTLDFDKKTVKNTVIGIGEVLRHSMGDLLRVTLEIDPGKYPEEYMYFKLKYG